MGYRRVQYRGFGGGANLTPIWIILAINLLFFIASFIRSDVIISTFGLTPVQFSDEPWTLVTSMFVHAGFFHILTNMLMLYFFGSFLLGLVGDKKFLLVYFIAGLMGNVAFLAIGNQFATAVGASGALYGVMGAMAVMRPRMKVYIWFMIPVDLWIVVIIGALLIAPGIAWQAHLGGLAAGLIAGYYFRRQEHGFRLR